MSSVKKSVLPLFVCLFLFSSAILNAQDWKYEDKDVQAISDRYVTKSNEKITKEEKKDKDKRSLYVHPETFDRIMQPIFSNYIIGFNGYAQKNTAASLQIASEEKKASLTGAWFFDRSILTVSGNTNVKEKVGTIFSDGKFQGGYGTEITYSYRPTSFLRYAKKDKPLLADRRQAYLKVMDEKIKYYTNAGKKAAAVSEYDKAIIAAKACKDLTGCEAAHKKVAEAQDELAKFIEDKDKKDSLIEWITKYEIEQARFTGFSFWLIEFKAAYRYEKINTIDTTKAMLYQEPGKIYFDRKKLSVSANHVRSRKFYSWLINFGVEYDYKTNLDDASTVTYTDSNKQDSANVTRTFKDDYTAYDISSSGYEQFGAVKVLGGWQVFVGKAKMFGARIFSDLVFNLNSSKSTKTGIWSGGLGLLFSGTEKPADESKVAAALDFRVEDMNGVTAKSIDLKTGEKTKTKERLSIKFTVGIPLNRLLNAKSK